MSEVLELPRLVFNIGAMGNRNFGKDNGIDTDAGPLAERATGRCRELFQEIAVILQRIQGKDKEAKFASTRFPLWHCLQGVAFGWIFGSVDRWKRLRRYGDKASVFSAEKPLVQVLGGRERGADTIVASTALAMPTDFVEYRHHPVIVREAEAPADDAAYSVGTIPKRWDGTNDPLPRGEARRRMESRRRRAFGFRAQSQALRHHCDLLIAIWDPDAEGKAGGTAESVAAALAERIPVLAIRFDDRNEAQADLLESPETLRQPAGSIGMARLETVLTRTLDFPDRAGHTQPHEHSTGYDPRVVFHEMCARPSRWIWTDLFKDGWVNVGSRFKAWRKARKQSSALPVGALGTQAHHYDRAKARASGYSGAFGDAYRGGIGLAYGLGLIAVLAAVIGGIAHGLHDHLAADGTAAEQPWWEWIVILCAVMEVGAIGLLFALARISKVEYWHAAYVDTRILAEALRPMKYLAPLGVHTPMPNLPPYQSGDDPRQLWPIWYFRALVRQAPLRIPDPKYPDLGALKTAILTNWIGDRTNVAKNSQVDHHRRNADAQERRSSRIERMTYALFVLVLVAAVVHLVDALAHIGWEGTHFLTLFFCTAGPAALAALSGYLAQIEAGRLHRRSEAMQALLAERYRVMNAVDVSGGDPESVEVRWRFAVEAANTAGYMVDETAEWSLIYKSSDIRAG